MDELKKSIDKLNKNACKLLLSVFEDGMSYGGEGEDEQDYEAATDVVYEVITLVHAHMKANGWPI